jgi:hypothetical protein
VGEREKAVRPRAMQDRKTGDENLDLFIRLKRLKKIDESECDREG